MSSFWKLQSSQLTQPKTHDSRFATVSRTPKIQQSILGPKLQDEVLEHSYEPTTAVVRRFKREQRGWNWSRRERLGENTPREIGRPKVTLNVHEDITGITDSHFSSSFQAQAVFQYSETVALRHWQRKKMMHSVRLASCV